MDPKEAAEFAQMDPDETASSGGLSAAGQLSFDEIVNALFNTEPNPPITKLPGGEATSYGIRGTLKFASGLLGKTMGIASFTDTAVHDWIRAALSASNDESDGEEQPEAESGGMDMSNIDIENL